MAKIVYFPKPGIGVSSEIEAQFRHHLIDLGIAPPVVKWVCANMSPAGKAASMRREITVTAPQSHAPSGARAMIEQLARAIG